MPRVCVAEFVLIIIAQALALRMMRCFLKKMFFLLLFFVVNFFYYIVVSSS